MNEFGEYLAHYGIKGQKKGIRRYQYEDGSLTPEGKERYGIKDNKKYYEYSNVKPDTNILGIKKSEERLKKGGVGTIYDNGRHFALVDPYGIEATNLPYIKEMVTPVLKSNSKDVVLERGSYIFSNKREMNGFLRKPAKYLVTPIGKTDGEQGYEVISKKHLEREQKKLEKQNKK